MTTRILIIDDDKNLQALLGEYFRDNHLAATPALTGRQGVAAVNGEGHFDLIVLDIMLPDIDGFETLKQVRAISRTPVIMLTAREAEADRIIGLELGADDYMHKPFNPRELIARIKAILRRSASAGADNRPEPAHRIIAGEVEIDFAGRRVYRSGRDIPMTGVEMDLLAELTARAGTPVPREDLLNFEF
ncbi:MAG: response regulator transcription factor [Thermodesulfobacteriota bacterium]|nr:response regulator transcription factor [Thermodesulfobacteriota bacterium]